MLVELAFIPDRPALSIITSPEGFIFWIARDVGNFLGETDLPKFIEKHVLREYKKIEVFTYEEMILRMKKKIQKSKEFDYTKIFDKLWHTGWVDESFERSPLIVKCHGTTPLQAWISKNICKGLH